MLAGRKGFAGNSLLNSRDEVEGFLALEEDSLMDFRDIDFRGMHLSEQELIHLFYDKFYETPILRRMDAVMEYFVDAYETLRGRDISDEDRELLQKKFDRMYVTKDIYEIYNRLMEYCGQDPLSDLPFERRKIPYEDVFPMLYLKYRLTGESVHKNIKHLVIDEMQDYSYLQYLILNRIFPLPNDNSGRLGHRLWIRNSRDVLNFLPKIFGKDVRMVVMNKSYRNTWEIANFAAKISGITDIELLERHGKEVEEKQFASEEELLSAVRDNLNVGEGGYETAAVITMTEEEAFDIYRLLQNRGIDASYVDRNSSAFRRGLTVTTFYLAKGLEFDQVFAIRGKKENPLKNQAEYICATRALHELYVYDVYRTGNQAG